MSMMTDDCIFESTGPAPDAMRFQGQKAVRACWDGLFEQSMTARFETEEIVSFGDRCVVRWVYHWTDPEPGHIRGIDLFRVVDGKVAEKLAYVKG